MFYDLPLEQLIKYVPNRTEPKDFDLFWKNTLEEARKFPIDAKFEKAEFGLTIVDTYDVTFNGFGGQPIKGWFILPKEAKGPLPCIVEYIGYGGGRSHPYTWLLFANAGYAHFVMDTRGQGSVWSPGDTPDPEVEGSCPQVPGVMTKGILDPKTYYYRRLFTDAVRAVEAARSNPAIDPAKIILTGGSQGGGITLAVSGLVNDLAGIMPEVPFLCHYREAVALIDTNPYFEITQFLKIHRDKIDKVFDTLSYFDGVNFAARANAPAIFSVGLMDNICPPRTVYAAFNHYAGKKEMKVWEFNNHEGGGTYTSIDKLKFLKSLGL